MHAERGVGPGYLKMLQNTECDLRGEPLPRNASGKVMKHVLLGEGDNTFVEE